MNKEELENRKLERRAKEWLVKDKGGSIIRSLVSLIKEFTEPREKRIAELESQIEKMKSDYDKLLDEKIELEDRLAESRECY